MCFHFFYTVQVDTIKNFFTTHACVCFYVMEYRKQKKWGFVLRSDTASRESFFTSLGRTIKNSGRAGNGRDRL